MKIMSIFGTRPEAIKLAPVIQELERRVAQSDLHSVVCVTAQHRQMLDQVLGLFHIVPDIDLNLMQAAQTPSQVAARVLTSVENVLLAERPDWILVQGDTTTVMAASIAAYHARVKVGHVEAGLRTGDRHNPFPEEMNRVLADHLSDWRFAPTPRAKENLLREGIPPATIRITGNTVTDALLQITNRPCPPEVMPLIEPGTKLILVTAHRRESFGAPLRSICAAIRELALEHTDVRFIYPVHLNPNVQEPVYEMLSGIPRIHLMPPADYLTLSHLMKQSTLIMTDSGGIQEEAPSLGVPVLVLRETTERPEAVEAGAACLVGTDSKRIVAEARRLLYNPQAHAAMALAVNPFGDGHASQRIADLLIHGECQEFVAGT